MKKAIHKIKEKYLLPYLSSSRNLSSFYYHYLSSFKREQRAVLYGRLMYEKDVKEAKGNEYLLRRNTHRLEKGLIMRPRRPVFARDYIRETVKNYQACLKDPEILYSSKESISWAHDVLKEYFSVVGDDPKVNEAKVIFESTEPLTQEELLKKPYIRNLGDTNIPYKDFLNLCFRRRSVRWFKEQPVPRELTEKALQAAAFSPSACNRQPFEFRIFDKPELARKVASVPMGTQGFSENFQAVAVLVGKLRAYPFERDRHVIYIDASLAAMSFMFALETLGLSSCPINWPDIEKFELEMEQLLGLEPDERPIMLIAYGYPLEEGMVPFSHKKSLEQLAVFNKISN